MFAAGRHKVVAYTDVRNARSLVLFDRLGFRREGLLHQGFKRADGLIDEVLFGLTADLWRHPTDGPVVELDPHPADVARLAEELFAFNAAAIGVDDGTEVAVFSATSSVASPGERPASPGPVAPSSGWCGCGRTGAGRASDSAC